MKLLKYLKIPAFMLIAALVLYWPLALMLETANAASVKQNPSKTVEVEDILPMPEELTEFDSGLAPNEYTSDNYIQPKYDPFNNKYHPYHDFEDQIKGTDRAANTVPRADFRIRTVQKGLADVNSGTVNTEFIFDAYTISDEETKTSKLQVRWDFESDGELDSYFSKSKKIKHKYDKPGVYNVTLEVLDQGGLVSSTSKEVTVVENTEPFAHFTYSPLTDTAESIFTFKTSESYDSQFKDGYLEYRFDWNGDGVFDTPYKRKTTWRHKFEDPGEYKVWMEAKDPDGAVDTTYAFITVSRNTPPVARFTVEKKEEKYYFDASESFDLENPEKLKFRWDFNYTGQNDIQYDTVWSYATKHSGFYDFAGEKTVRLQVVDKDGAVETAYVKFVVE